MSDWTIRAATADDESGLSFHWLKSFAHSAYGRARNADADRTDAEAAYWAAHEPIVFGLLRRCDVSLVVDPAAPHVFWAMLCAEPGRIHYLLSKRVWHNADRDDGTREVASMFKALLGPRYEAPHAMSHELPEMRRAGLPVPTAWHYDPYAVYERASK